MLLLFFLDGNSMYLRWTTGIFYGHTCSEMIAIVKLINTPSHIADLTFVCKWEQCKSALTKCPIFNKVSSCCHIRSLYLFIIKQLCTFWWTSPHFPHLFSPGNHLSTLSFYVILIFRFHITWGHEGLFLSVSSLFHLAECSHQKSSFQPHLPFSVVSDINHHSVLSYWSWVHKFLLEFSTRVDFLSKKLCTFLS